nr:MAG TPA: hypothetical protein [Caudoviricetes sp.]
MFSISSSVYSSKTKSQLKILNTVYVVFTISKFIFRVFYSIVSFSSVIYQTVIGLPTIRVNNALVQIAKF